MDNTNSGLKKILVIDDEGVLHSPMDTLRRNRQPSDRQSCIATVNAY